MDPEQIYQEVLSEEQGKGSPSAVAEARAKAARQRAVHGSPHPKEPRWWPGSQPQFEGGGDGAAPAPADEPEEEPVAEEAPEPAAAPPDIGDASQSERPDAPAPAPAAGTETTAPAPAAAPAAAAVAAPAAAAPAQPAAQTLPAGVTHGTDSGNRLRPEDSVGTDAQFDAQKALAERRRLIDELVSTGVPAATAQNAGRPKAPMLLLAYLLIPLIAIGLLAASDDEEAAAEGGGEPAPVEQQGPTEAVAAEGLQFDVETITLVAGEKTSIEFDNKDSAPHNIAIYEDDSASKDIFVGEQITASTTTYEFDAPKAGEYYFQCDVHPDMNGDVVSE